MRIVVAVLMAVAVSACSVDNVGGQAQADRSLPSTTSSSSGVSTTSASSVPTTKAGPLSNIEACSLLTSASLPAAWQPLEANPKPILQLGDSNCDIANPESGLGVSITIYRGPGRGIDELSKTVGPPLSAVDVSGRKARIYHDYGGNTCGILFDFGPDQGLIIAGSPAIKSTDDPCAIVTTAATTMAPNLPPS